MAELTQKTGLPEKSGFGPLGRLAKCQQRGRAMGKADGGRGGGPAVGLRCLTGGQAGPGPRARGLSEEEERRKARGSCWTQQTAPAPGVGSAQRLLSHPVRARSAREQM